MKHKDMVALMGKIVLVEERLVREITREPEDPWVAARRLHAKWDRHVLDEPRAGWVVGFRNLQIGCSRSDIDGQFHFKPSGSVPCVMVVYWPTMRPVHVPLDGFRVDGDMQQPKAPAYRWTERDRDALRSEMKTAPRDAKGRWRGWGYNPCPDGTRG